LTADQASARQANGTNGVIATKAVPTEAKMKLSNAYKGIYEAQADRWLIPKPSRRPKTRFRRL
jgi:hypothetical protein